MLGWVDSHSAEGKASVVLQPKRQPTYTNIPRNLRKQSKRKLVSVSSMIVSAAD